MRHRDAENPEGAKLYEELVIPLLDDLYRLASRLERDPDRAQDLLQDSLLQGFRRFGQLQTPSSFRPWMGRIMVRTYLNARRKRGSEAALTETHPELLEMPGGTVDANLVLSARRVARELKAALDRLPSDWAVAVFLVDVQGYTYADAAEALDAAPGTVASRVARGRAALRKHLRHLAEERGWVDP